jgi:uncharacterized membrane protein
MSTTSGSIVYSRRHPRVNVELPADFRILLPNKDLDRHSQNIKSVSGGGLMFISPVPLTIGTRLEMTIYNFIVQINFIAEVIWIQKVLDAKPSQFKYGLMFSQISDENLVQISRILNSNIPNPN